MAWAHGIGATGLGFGLGFLNFLGTILFILALVWFIRWIAAGGRRADGMRRSGPCGWFGTGFGQGPRSSESGTRDHAAHPWAGHPWAGHREQDTAMGALRERLARGDIDVAAFEPIEQALATDASRVAARGGTPEQRGDTALATLRLRLAQGEITVEQFDMVRAVLAR